MRSPHVVIGLALVALASIVAALAQTTSMRPDQFIATSWTWSKPQRVGLSTVAISTSTFTPDMTAAQDFKIVLVHASCPCTLANPTAPGAYPQHGVIEIDQSATGSDTIGTWGSSWIAPGGTSTLALSSGASARDFFSYVAIDSTHFLIAPGGLNASH